MLGRGGGASGTVGATGRGKAAGREPQKPAAAEPLRKQAAAGQVQPGHPVHPETEDAV